MSARSRARRWAANALLGGALMMGAVMLLPALLGYERYVVTGASMQPKIAKGSLLFAKPVAVTNLRVGDIITFVPPAGSQPSPHAVTHRIVWAGRGRDGRRAFRTRGDNNTVVDPWRVSLDAPQQARYAFHVPFAGYPLAALGVRWVRVGLIGLPALLIALSLASGLWRDAGAELAARHGEEQAA